MFWFSCFFNLSLAYVKLCSKLKVEGVREVRSMSQVRIHTQYQLLPFPVESGNRLSASSGSGPRWLGASRTRIDTSAAYCADGRLSMTTGTNDTTKGGVP